MKLRTILFVVAALAGISLPVRAQLVSHMLNLQPGYNAISLPVLRGSNTVGDLFPPDMAAGSILVKFNSSGGGYVMNHYDQALGGWEFPDGFAGSLLPGEGAFLFVPAPVTLNITGAKPIPHGLVGARTGFNLVGCQVPEPCTFEQLMGFTPQPGDTVYHYNQPITNPGGPAQEASSTNRFLANGWDTPPIIQPFQAVFVEIASEPRVIIDPQQLTVPAGSNATFNAVVIGGAPRGFQWRRNGNPLTGQTNFSITITNVQQASAGSYSVVVQFGPGQSVTSVVARLTVAFPPIITKQPQSLIATQGLPTVLRVQAAGTPPLFYQWFKDGMIVQPFTMDLTNFVIPNVQLAHAGNYFVRVMNIAGEVTSTQAMLTVLVPPRIVQHPTNQMVNAGANVTLSVDVDQLATDPVTFQWLRNGNPLPANGRSLTISNIRPDQSGIYRVIAINPAGTELSEEAFIMVAGGGGGVFRDNLLPFTGGITGPNGLVQGTNINMTREPNEPRHAGKRGSNSVWVTYFATQPGIVTFETRGSSFDTLLAAYTGNDFATLKEVASDDDSGGFLSSTISFSVEPNVAYQIVVDGHAGQMGNIILSWSLDSTSDVLPVIMDQPDSQVVARGATAVFQVAIEGTAAGFQWFFNRTTLVGIGPTLIIPNVSEANVGQYFVRIRAGNHFIDSRIVDLDLREIDGPGQPPAIRAFDKFEDLLAALENDPPGAVFGPASIVLGYTGSQTFSTAGSGGQNGEPVHCGVVGGHSKWYAYIPPANGTLYLNTDGSNFDTLLAVYTGCCTFATLTPVSCDNNSGTNELTSSLNFQANSNTVYYIAVDGVSGVTGTVKLNYRLLVPMMLTNLASTTNSLTFQLNATPLWPFFVQRSTNFIDWPNFLTATTASGIYLFTDTNLPPGRRFYRSMQTP